VILSTTESEYLSSCDECGSNEILSSAASAKSVFARNMNDVMRKKRGELDELFKPMTTLGAVDRGRKITPGRYVGIVGQTEPGDELGSLRDYYRGNVDMIPDFDDSTRKKVTKVLAALLRPEVEETVLREHGRSLRKWLGRRDKVLRDPRVYMPENLMQVAAACVSEEMLPGAHAVQINLGMTAGPINPTMLAYPTLAFNRYSELIRVCAEFGFDPQSVPVGLRIFSTAGFLSTHNSIDDEDVIAQQQYKRELLGMSSEQERWMKAFVKEFFPEIVANFPTWNVAQFPSADFDELNRILRKLAPVFRSMPQIAEEINELGTKHGGEFAHFFSRDYLAYHASRDTFRDGDLDEPSIRVSIGGPSERVFNIVRQALLRARKSSGKVTPMTSMITAPAGFVCLTPSYLDRRSFMPEKELTLLEFLEGRDPLAKQLLEDPSKFSHVTRGEWMLLLETIKKAKGLSDLTEAARIYHDFASSMMSPPSASK